MWSFLKDSVTALTGYEIEIKKKETPAKAPAFLRPTKPLSDPNVRRRTALPASVFDRDEKYKRRRASSISTIGSTQDVASYDDSSSDEGDSPRRSGRLPPAIDDYWSMIPPRRDLLNATKQTPLLNYQFLDRIVAQNVYELDVALVDFTGPAIEELSVNGSVVDDENSIQSQVKESQLPPSFVELKDPQPYEEQSSEAVAKLKDPPTYVTQKDGEMPIPIGKSLEMPTLDLSPEVKAKGELESDETQLPKNAPLEEKPEEVQQDDKKTAESEEKSNELDKIDKKPTAEPDSAPKSEPKEDDLPTKADEKASAQPSDSKPEEIPVDDNDSGNAEESEPNSGEANSAVDDTEEPNKHVEDLEEQDQKPLSANDSTLETAPKKVEKPSETVDKQEIENLPEESKMEDLKSTFDANSDPKNEKPPVENESKEAAENSSENQAHSSEAVPPNSSVSRLDQSQHEKLENIPKELQGKDSKIQSAPQPDTKQIKEESNESSSDLPPQQSSLSTLAPVPIPHEEIKEVSLNQNDEDRLKGEEQSGQEASPAQGSKDPAIVSKQPHSKRDHHPAAAETIQESIKLNSMVDVLEDPRKTFTSEGSPVDQKAIDSLKDSDGKEARPPLAQNQMTQSDNGAQEPDNDSHAALYRRFRSFESDERHRRRRERKRNRAKRLRMVPVEGVQETDIIAESLKVNDVKPDDYENVTPRASNYSESSISSLTDDENDYGIIPYAMKCYPPATTIIKDFKKIPPGPNNNRANLMWKGMSARKKHFDLWMSSSSNVFISELLVQCDKDCGSLPEYLSTQGRTAASGEKAIRDAETRQQIQDMKLLNFLSELGPRHEEGTFAVEVKNQLEGEPKNDISVPERLVQSANTHKNSFENLVKRIVEFASGNNNGKPGPPLTYQVNIKATAAIQEKAKLKYNGDALQVKDVLRAHVIFPDPGAMICGLTFLHKQCNDHTEKDEVKKSESATDEKKSSQTSEQNHPKMDGSSEVKKGDGKENAGGDRVIMKIVRMKNLFNEQGIDQYSRTSLPTGYRHILINLFLDNSFVAELQFSLHSFYSILGKDGGDLHKILLKSQEGSQNQEGQSIKGTTGGNEKAMAINPSTGNGGSTAATAAATKSKTSDDGAPALGGSEGGSGIAAAAATAAAAKRRGGMSSTSGAAAAASLVGSQKTDDDDGSRIANAATSRRGALGNSGIAAAAAAAAMDLHSKEEINQAGNSDSSRGGGGIAAMAAAAAAAKQRKKSSGAESSDGGGGGIAAMAAAAAAAKQKKKSSGAESSGGGGGIAAMAAAAAAAKRKRTENVNVALDDGSAHVVLTPVDVDADGLNQEDFYFEWMAKKLFLSVDEVRLICEDPGFIGCLIDFALVDALSKKMDIASLSSLFILAELLSYMSRNGSATDQRVIDRCQSIHEVLNCRVETNDDALLPAVLKAFSLELLKQASQKYCHGIFGYLSKGSCSEHLTLATIDALSFVGCSYGSTGDWESAENVFGSALLIVKKDLPVHHPLFISLNLDLALSNIMIENMDKANALISQSQTALRKYLSDSKARVFSAVQARTESKVGSGKVVYYDPCTDLIYQLERYTESLERQLSREIFRLVQSDNEAALANHIFVADTLSAVATCISMVSGTGSETVQIASKEEKESRQASKHIYYWSLACSYYDRTLRELLTSHPLSYSTSTLVAYSMSRCLREIGHVDRAMEILESVTTSLKSAVKLMESKPERSSRYGSSSAVGWIKHEVSYLDQEITDQRHYLARCYRLMAACAIDIHRNETGRLVALDYLHDASETLRRVLSGDVASQRIQDVCMNLYKEVEADALDLFYPLHIMEVPERRAASPVPADGRHSFADEKKRREMEARSKLRSARSVSFSSDNR